MSSESKYTKLFPYLIIFTVLISYSQLFLNEFINYDDPAYIYENSNLRVTGISPFIWSLTSTYASNWHPLTWWLHTVDVRLFGLNPVGHHSVNLLFHTSNALLLFFFLRRTTGSHYRSLFVALLFALHPLHVESVAWAAELKDLLSAFFWLLTLHAYYSYSKEPTLGRYALVIVSFILGLSSKPMIVTLPFALLLLDYWPLGRLRFRHNTDISDTDIRQLPLRKLGLEKVPFILLSIVVSVITVNAQKAGGSLDSFEQTSMAQCIGNAFISYTGYLQKLFWPTKLAVVYPFESASISLTSTAVAVMLLLGISLVVTKMAGKQPYLLVGWLWYLGTLVPVIGFIRIGHHSMADRYTYIPMIGIFIMLSWGMSNITGEVARQKQLALLAGGVLFSILMVLTWIQVGYWRNSFTLFTHAIQSTDNNWMAYNNLGEFVLKHGDPAQATHYLQESIRISPGYSDSHNNLGTAYEKLGKNSDAIREFQIATSLNPKNPDVHFNLGLAYHLAGLRSKALAESLLLQDLNGMMAQELNEVIVGKRQLK